MTREEIATLPAGTLLAWRGWGLLDCVVVMPDGSLGLGSDDFDLACTDDFDILYGPFDRRGQKLADQIRCQALSR